MFKIKDIRFTIEQAYVDAYVDEMENELVFGLQIRAKAKELYDWDAHINSEILLRVKPGEIKNWFDLNDKIIQWDGYPEDEEEPHAFLYIYEHEPIYQSKVIFENRDKAMFVKWNALCDVGEDEEYSNHLPLQIETRVLFEGILFGKNKSEECCRKMIEPFLPEEDFHFIENKYGVSLLIPINGGPIETNNLVLGNY